MFWVWLEEFKDRGVAVNALWARTAIATAAVQNHLGGDEIMKISRTVEIMADAAYEILTKDSKSLLETSVLMMLFFTMLA